MARPTRETIHGNPGDPGILKANTQISQCRNATSRATQLLRQWITTGSPKP